MKPNGTAQSGPPAVVITTSAHLGRVARSPAEGKSHLFLPRLIISMLRGNVAQGPQRPQ